MPFRASNAPGATDDRENDVSIVGIDLGTTNTVVGAVKDGHAITLRDERGEYLIPSVVSFHPNGSVLVGRVAKERRLIDAQNTVYSIKRLIGRSFGSQEVTLARSRFPFQMREGPGQASLVAVRGETFTLPEISAFVLRHAKAVAEKALGSAVDRAVITVPANFNDLQRAATKVAGRVAGLEVVRILNEPTAAALAYGYGRGAEERIAIYDFGGGTFDVTLLDLAGNVFEVLATAGNTFLGGDDIDLGIAERMADRFLVDFGFDARADPQAFERLRYHAEGVKVALSSSDRAEIDLPDMDPQGRPMPFSMTRSELESIATPLVLNTFEVCKEALGIARLEPSAFDQVILVGGSTRVPLVRRMVEEFFLRTPLDRIKPDEVVAIGAAIQANALSSHEKRRSGVPKPPMPAARSLEESVTTALPRPGKRGTNPFGAPVARPAAPPGKSAPPPLPRRRAPAQRGGTLGGVGQGTPPELAHAVPGSSEASFEDDEPTHVGAPPDAFALLRPEAPPLEVEAPPFTADTHSALPDPSYRTPMQTQIGLGSDRPLSAEALEAALPSRPPLPLLVDVTPRNLTVETVGGFCDVIVARNTKIPCEESRVFVTAHDGQHAVNVRVGQGESPRFFDNTLLGELELSGLRPAPRGKVQVIVTFALDTDGILDVRAADAETGKAATARIRLVGLPDSTEVERMAAQHWRRNIQ
jgi:molecular chaperone DnaK